MASEEEPDIIHIPEGFRAGKYVLLFDPLDGSSNIDVNVPVGTIFSVYQKITRGTRGEMEDMLQPGRRQVAAGYVIYGSSTMMVYTTGQGAHGFTLDPSIGEFLLSHPDIKIPERARYLSVNDAYEQDWPEPTRALMRRYRGMDGVRKPLNVRYVGSLVADFHRNLLGGGCLLLSGQRQVHAWQVALALRSQPAGVHRRAGWWPRHGRTQAHPRCRSHGAASTHAALHREQGGSRNGQRVPAADARSAQPLAARSRRSSRERGWGRVARRRPQHCTLVARTTFRA
jgi:hypothetical protein